MEATKEDLKHKSKQIVELISGIANISMSDDKENDKQMEVREKIQTHLRRVEEETKQLMSEISEELEGLVDPLSQEVAAVFKRIDCGNSVLRSLAMSCFNTGKKYKEALDALEAFLELNEAFYEINKEKIELETKLMEMENGSAVTNDQPEKKIEAKEEKSEVNSISSNNRVENEKEIEAAKLKDSLKIDDGLRRSKRFVKEPVEDQVKDTKAKGKGKGKKRV